MDSYLSYYIKINFKKLKNIILILRSNKLCDKLVYKLLKFTQKTPFKFILMTFII